MTLIQRFGSALNLNIHFHMLFMDAVYLLNGAYLPLFRPVAGPSANELQRLVEQIAARVGQVLERRGLIERERLERLCRQVSRPPVATERQARSASGQVRDALKTPYRDGTTQIVVAPHSKLRTAATLVAKAAGLERCAPGCRAGALAGRMWGEAACQARDSAVGCASDGACGPPD